MTQAQLALALDNIKQFARDANAKIAVDTAGGICHGVVLSTHPQLDLLVLQDDTETLHYIQIAAIISVSGPIL